MRTVGCNEIASDPVLLNRTLHLFEIIEKSGTPTGIVFPVAANTGEGQEVVWGLQPVHDFPEDSRPEEEDRPERE